MSTVALPLATQFELIDREILLLRAKWQQVETLFGSEDNVRLLNQCASGFFHLVQDTFLDDVILGIARLLDPAQSVGKRDNLTLARLLSSLPATLSPASLTTLDAELQDIRTTAGALKDIRNKLLAHNSLDYKQAGSATLYNSITRNLIASLLTRIGALMNLVRNELGEMTLLYEATDYPQGAERLLVKLRRLAALPSRTTGGGPGTAAY